MEESSVPEKHHFFRRAATILRDCGIRSFVARAGKKMSTVAFCHNSATWYCARPGFYAAKRISAADFFVDFDRHHEAISWLKDQHQVYGWMYVTEELALMAAEKHIIATLRKENEIIGYLKIGRKKVYIMDYEAAVFIPDAAAVIYDSFILPRYRGRGLAPFLITEAMQFLKKNGYTAVWCHIPEWNVSSKKAYSRSGFRKIAHIHFIRLLKFSFFSQSITRMLRRHQVS